MGTVLNILIPAALAGYGVYLAVRMFRRRGRGCCRCGGCPMAGSCQSNRKEADKK